MHEAGGRCGSALRSVLASICICAAMARGDLASGVKGVVLIQPTCPGPQRQGQDCRTPYAHAALVLASESGEIVARASATVDGKFVMPAPVGRYVLRVEIAGSYPRCEERAVSVHRGKMVEVELSCDSGMR